MVSHECAAVICLPLYIQLLKTSFQATEMWPITWSELLLKCSLQLANFTGLNEKYTVHEWYACFCVSVRVHKFLLL